MFPLYVRGKAVRSVVRETPDMFGERAGSDIGEPAPNLTPLALKYLTKLTATPEDLFFHIVAILHAPAYCAENIGAFRQDWPRVPLPSSFETLGSGAELGRQVATLLDTETDAPGVTSGSLRPALKGLAELTVTGTAKPKTPDLSLTARWGYAGQGGVVMPGPGLVRNGTRGEGFLDIHLNTTTCWRDVPAEVWTYTLGGYQVLTKWLSYRELLLHRRLRRPRRSTSPSTSAASPPSLCTRLSTPTTARPPSPWRRTDRRVSSAAHLCFSLLASPGAARSHPRNSSFRAQPLNPRGRRRDFSSCRHPSHEPESHRRCPRHAAMFAEAAAGRRLCGGGVLEQGARNRTVKWRRRRRRWRG